MRVSGHVKLVERKRGPVWYMRQRGADGTDTQKLLGPAWTRKGRPPAGYYTQQTAERALAVWLAGEETKVGTVPVRGVTFAEAATEWLRYTDQDRECRPSTLRDYKGTVAKLVAAFGSRRLDSITPLDVEGYKAGLLGQGRLAARTINRHLVVMGGIFRRAEARWGIRHNPAAQVQRQRERYGGPIAYLKPAEIQALVRATPDPQDAAMFLTAALTGLRQGELIALTWADVDFELQRVHVRRSYDPESKRALPPKSGKVRSVPMVDEVGAALDNLSKRQRFTDPDDLVFPEWDGTFQYHGDLRSRFYAALKAAGLKRIRFHDLRHTFGTLAVQKRPIREVMEYMGHAHISTTMVYSHYVPAGDAAAQLTEAFRAEVLAPDASNGSSSGHVGGMNGGAPAEVPANG